MKKIILAFAPLTLAAMLAACGGPAKTDEGGEKAETEKAEGAEKPGDPNTAVLSAQQIADAGIEVTRPTIGGVAGAIEIPATIEGDPQGVQVVSAAIGGASQALTELAVNGAFN